MRHAAAGSLAAAFLAVAAQAQSIGLGERAKLHYRGHAGVVQWAFPQEGGSRQSHFTTQWVGDLDLTLALSPSAPLELRVHPRFNFDIDRSRAFPARFDDLYLDFFTRWFELRAGYQVFSWKTVESISQADVLNQVDREEDFLDPPKIGEPAVRARFILPTPSQNVLELYYLPWFTPAPLPGPENRYYFFTDRSLRLLREKDDFTYGSEDGRLRPQWAARWQTQLSGFDVSLYYFHGYRRFPLFRPVGPPDSSGAFDLTHYYPPLFQGGLTFQGALGNWLWKGETAFTRYEQDLHGPSGAAVDPFLAYTAGFEYTFYSPFLQNHDLGAILELVGDTDVEKDEEDLEGFRPFHTYLFAGIRYAFNNTGDRALLLGTLLDYVNLDAIYQLEYTERLFDRMSVKAGLSGVAARSSSQFRPFRQAARISGELKFNF